MLNEIGNFILAILAVVGPGIAVSALGVAFLVWCTCVLREFTK